MGLSVIDGRQMLPNSGEHSVDQIAAADLQIPLCIQTKLWRYEACPKAELVLDILSFLTTANIYSIGSVIV